MNNLAEKEFYTVIIGSSILAMNAGVINAISMAGSLSVAVAHVTGNLTKLSISLVELSLDQILSISSMIACFMFGAFMGGFIVGDSKFRLGRSYGFALLIESGTLFIAFLLLLHDNIAGAWFATFSCGLQNALTTNYSGAVIRTTHMTGIATDVGNMLGQACRKDASPELWRLKVHVPLMVSFILGAIIGRLLFYLLGEYAMIMPSLFAGSVGVVYLSLPFIKQASEILVDANKKVLSGIPGFEVRILGNPLLAKKKMEIIGESMQAITKQASTGSLRASTTSISAVGLGLGNVGIINVDQMNSRIGGDIEKTVGLEMRESVNGNSSGGNLLSMSGGGAVEVVYSPISLEEIEGRRSSVRSRQSIVGSERLLHS